MQLLYNFVSKFYPALRECFLLYVGTTDENILHLKYLRFIYLSPEIITSSRGDGKLSFLRQKILQLFINNAAINVSNIALAYWH